MNLVACTRILACFGKEACSIVRKMPVFRTDVPHSQHKGQRCRTIAGFTDAQYGPYTDQLPEVAALTSQRGCHAPDTHTETDNVLAHASICPCPQR